MRCMPTVQERVGVLEERVANIDEKVTEIKVDIKDMHDCLDRTRDQLDSKLETMLSEYRSNRDKFYEHSNEIHKEQTAQHNVLAGKISELEKFRFKWTYMVAGAVAMAGILSGHFEKIEQFFK